MVGQSRQSSIDKHADYKVKIAILTTWVNENGDVIKSLLSCSVQDLLNEKAKNDAGYFGAYCLMNLILLAKASAASTSSLGATPTPTALKVTSYLQTLTSIFGCACHRLHLAVKHHSG